MKTNGIIRSTFIIVAVSVMAKFASFITEALLASFLGTTYKSDAYYMVASIKDVIYPMLSVGIWKVFLPIYKEKVTLSQNEKADDIANKVTTFFTLFSAIVVFILFLFSDNVVKLIAPGFSEETAKLCGSLLKLSSPMYILIIAAAVYSSMLQCHGKFFASQIREVVSYIPTIIAGIFFYKIWGVKSLAVALVFGGALRLVIEIPFVDWGYSFKPDFRFKDSELKLMLKRLPSAMLSEGVNQANTMVDKIMASSLPAGAVSSLSYGNKLTHVFSGLFSSAVATAMYPKVVELVAVDQKKELSKLIAKIINIFALLMIPITLACFMYSLPLVKLVYERGAFDSESAQLTSGVFSCYCIGLFFVGCNTVITNVFYGYGDTKSPLYISIVNMIANVLGNILFIYLWGIKGLALSTSTSAIIAFFVRLVLVRKYVELEYRAILQEILKIIFAGIVACGLPRVLFLVINVNIFCELILAAVIGVIIYIILVKVLCINEVDYLLLMVSQKIRKK